MLYPWSLNCLVETPGWDGPKRAFLEPSTVFPRYSNIFL